MTATTGAGGSGAAGAGAGDRNGALCGRVRRAGRRARRSAAAARPWRADAAVLEAPRRSDAATQMHAATATAAALRTPRPVAAPSRPAARPPAPTARRTDAAPQTHAATATAAARRTPRPGRRAEPTGRAPTGADRGRKYHRAESEGDARAPTGPRCEPARGTDAVSDRHDRRDDPAADGAKSQADTGGDADGGVGERARAAAHRRPCPVVEVVPLGALVRHQAQQQRYHREHHDDRDTGRDHDPFVLAQHNVQLPEPVTTAAHPRFASCHTPVVARGEPTLCGPCGQRALWCTTPLAVSALSGSFPARSVGPNTLCSTGYALSLLVRDDRRGGGLLVLDGLRSSMDG